MTNEQNTDGMLAFPVGKTADGREIWSDFGRVPHILVAGVPGTGKTEFLLALICTLAQEHSPEEVHFVLGDPKLVELAEFAPLPHLQGPIVQETAQAEVAFQWLVLELERRRGWFGKAGCGDIAAYNAENPGAKMPYIVVGIDEIADFMLCGSQIVEPTVLRLATEGAAAGIHLVVATSRSASNIFTDAILEAVLGRMVFKVSDWMASERLLGTDEADSLEYRSGGIWREPSGEHLRVQGRFTPSEKVAKMVADIAARCPHTTVLGPWARVRGQEEERLLRPRSFEEIEVLYARGKETVLESKRAATSLLQRKLHVSHSDALWLMALLEARGVVGPDRGCAPRDIMVEAGFETNKETE